MRLNNLRRILRDEELSIFVQRIADMDIEPRDDDPLKLKIVLRAYQRWIESQITPEHVKQLQQRLIGAYNEHPNNHTDRDNE